MMRFRSKGLDVIRPLIVATLPIWCPVVFGAAIDLRPQWDETIPLANPHKGWYHHFYDNHVDKYLVESDTELLDFPGMDHVYLRLAWAYLEPEEGRFNWRVLEEQVEKWTAHGLGIALRITCKESNANRMEQKFATPRWVHEAGAQGGFHGYKVPSFTSAETPASKAGAKAVAPDLGKAPEPNLAWEPVYDDPVFLGKLDQFLAALAARYDGKPWLRYVDIGSFGDWGEGHTSHGSKRKYGFDTLARHVDLHVRHFRRTQLVVSDDFVFNVANPEDRPRLHAKLVKSGVSYRDDSILVDWYVQTCSPTFTVRSPEYFADAWPKTPTVLELEHYGIVKNKGNWTPRPGSSLEKFGGGRTGADYFRGAIEQLHATYIGYHGYAREWLAENPSLTVELLNRCGYWFFPHKVELPDALIAGQANTVSITWQNRGVARAYHAYDLILRLEGPDSFEQELPSGNTRWLPGSTEMTWRETYTLAIPTALKPGEYSLKLKLQSREANRDVKLPLKAHLLDKNGCYTIARARVR